MNTKIINYPEQPLKISDLPEYLYDLSKDQLFDLFVNNKITEEIYIHLTGIIDSNVNNEIKKNMSKDIQYKLYDDKGKPVKYFPNFVLLLEHYGINFKYNEITRQIEILGMKSRNLNDCIIDVETICIENDFTMTENKIWSYMQRLANLNSYNPVKEHLMNCYRNWDGESRLQQVFDSVITQDTYNKSLKELLMKRWLVATARITTNSLEFDKPLQCEGVLVFKGEQGLGKTSWINSIIPQELKKYFRDNVALDVSNKDSIFEATSNWISELGEMGHTLKGGVDALKMFFTNGMDRQRRPYDKAWIDMPRMTSFFGTINDKEFLKDDTGNRRYWVVDVKDFNMSEILDMDTNQLWGEIMHLFLDKHEPHWLSKEEQLILNHSNEESRIVQPIEYKVEVNFDWDKPKEEWEFVKTSIITDRLDLKVTKGLRTAIERFGGEYKNSNGKRGYLVPPFLSVYSLGK